MAEWLLSGPRLVGVLGGSSEQSPQNPTPPPLPPPPPPQSLRQPQPRSPHRDPSQPRHPGLCGMRRTSPQGGPKPGGPKHAGPGGSRQVGWDSGPTGFPGLGSPLHSHSDPCPTDSPWQAGRRQAGGGAQPTTQWCGPSGREGADLPGAGTPQPAPPPLWTFLSARVNRALRQVTFLLERSGRSLGNPKNWAAF